MSAGPIPFPYELRDSGMGVVWEYGFPDAWQSLEIPMKHGATPDASRKKLNSSAVCNMEVP